MKKNTFNLINLFFLSVLAATIIFLKFQSPYIMKILVEKETTFYVKDKNIRDKMVKEVNIIYKEFKEKKISKKKINKAYIFLNTFFEFHKNPDKKNLEETLNVLKKYSKN